MGGFFYRVCAQTLLRTAQCPTDVLPIQLGIHKPSLWRLARWTYGAPSKLFLSTREGEAILWSAQGVRQGDPFKGYVFSIALKMPELYLYFDDITGTSTRNAEETYTMIIEESNTTVDQQIGLR